MTFDYYFTMRAEGQLEIDDLGNFTIQAFTDLAKQYLLTAYTEMGVTRVIEMGPLPFDIALPKELFPSKINYSYETFDFKESKIAKRIEKFLNNPLITQAQVVEFDTIKNNFINLVDLR